VELLVEELEPQGEVGDDLALEGRRQLVEERGLVRGVVLVRGLGEGGIVGIEAAEPAPSVGIVGIDGARRSPTGAEELVDSTRVAVASTQRRSISAQGTGLRKPANS
jgi:hypothetical protein